ncbi:MAG: hypothetical protein IJO29_07495 [Oscillospiraceae bacterium]|nr:hypothetical protein [Oscillospiraceae bacterium]
MKKVYDTIGILGVVLLFVAAALSDSGTVSLSKVLILGIFASAMIIFSLGGVNASEYCECSEGKEIIMQGEQCLQKSA